MSLKLEYGDHPCKTITDQWLTLLSSIKQLGSSEEVRLAALKVSLNIATILY
jgi:hypothetical protein